MKQTIFTAFVLVFTIAYVSGQDGEIQETVVDVAPIDPCLNVQCRIGEMCEEGKCVCAQQCDADWEGSNRQICVDKMTTYNHICDWNRHKCYCRSNAPQCKAPEFDEKTTSESSFIYYYGPCKNLAAECNWELWQNSMPYIMRDWFEYLFNYKWSVPATMSLDVDETLVRPFNSKARSKAQALTLDSSEARKGKIVAYWFCEIDRNNDQSLSQGELSRLTQILLPANPCIDQFFSTCANKASLSFSDWSTCFKLTPEDQVACGDYSE